MATHKIGSDVVCDVCGVRRTIAEFVQCSHCRPAGKEPPFYCARHCSESDCNHAVDCRQYSHETCWDSHLPKKKGREKHEKSGALLDYFVRLIIHSETDNEVQAKLHERDRKAKWFMVSSAGLEDSEPTVQISDRFRRLCNPGYLNNRWSSEQYPSIVSFIGDTGVGKSTLVNAMAVMGQIELQATSGAPVADAAAVNSILRLSDLPKVQQARKDGPVTRSGDPQRATEPTSSGVHLYLDPGETKVRFHSAREEEPVPILFADCEGFKGGMNKTNAERSRESTSNLQPRRYSSSSLAGVPPRSSWSAGRSFVDELEITLPEIKNAGKAGAELYYARFLYAFSDVIVFVTNNDQQLHTDIQRLLEWAASAVHKAINHLPRKTLIVVRNMPARHNVDYYRESFLYQSLFGSMDNIWETSRELAAFKKRHDRSSRMRENEIHSNDSFLRIFFQNVEVCYIPNKGFATAEEVIRQYRALRERIVQAVEKGQRARAASWTRYDIPSLSHLFGRAFHHFAKFPGPFDFYTAARKDNPMSVTMADHIANLLRYMQASEIRLNEFPPVVAVCLVSFVHRDFRQAIEPKEIFDRTLRRICAKAIQTYQNKYQRCAFRFPGDGQRCKATRLTHPEHCSSDERGTTIPGGFDSSDYYEMPADTLWKVEKCFIDMFRKLCSSVASGSVLRLAPPHAVALCRQEVLNSKVLQESKFWRHSKSNKTCFTCLQSVPDHALPCGHVYCENCVKDFGLMHENLRYCVEMSHCVLCGDVWPTRPPQLVRLKPKCAGVRVLTLDGGGVRGIVELAILREIEDRVGLGVPIRDLFDLIVGTSTGGIIALGLAMTEYSVDEMRTKFLELSERTFKKDRGGPLSLLDPLNVLPALLMTVKAWESKYKTTPLREGLQTLFGTDKSMFPSATFTGYQRVVRVAVTSTTAGDPCLFTNYNRLVSTDNKDFEREDEQSKEARVWEAALATSAAPIYFKPYERGHPPKLYSDGALHANLPVAYALWETQKIWPPVDASRPADDAGDRELTSSVGSLGVGGEAANEVEDAGSDLEPPMQGREVHLDVLVSIGTGEQARVDRYPNAFEIGGLKQAYLSFIKAMDTEASWREFKARPQYNRYLHQRLNVPLSGKYVGIDDWSEMRRLEKAVHDYYRECSDQPNGVQDVASRLAANLLFFEPDTPTASHLHPPQNFYRIQGQIWCRLPKESAPLVALTDRITGFWFKEDSPKTKMKGRYLQLRVPDDWKSEIRTQGKHLALPITIKTMDPDATYTVAVGLKEVYPHGGASFGLPKEDRRFPISGFPVLFRDLQAQVTM